MGMPGLNRGLKWALFNFKAQQFAAVIKEAARCIRRPANFSCGGNKLPHLFSIRTLRASVLHCVIPCAVVRVSAFDDSCRVRPAVTGIGISPAR